MPDSSDNYLNESEVRERLSVDARAIRRFLRLGWLYPLPTTTGFLVSKGSAEDLERWHGGELAVAQHQSRARAERARLLASQRTLEL